jgi:hypothetical protein
MEIQRKPKLFFDQDASPRSVTFDDGTRWMRSLPWARFAEAVWDYSDPGTIRVEIGDWQIVICGHNLEPLFEAIETARLQRVRAHPEFADDPTRESDVFATSIRFVHLSALAAPGKEKPRPQLDLDLA